MPGNPFNVEAVEEFHQGGRSNTPSSPRSSRLFSLKLPALSFLILSAFSDIHFHRLQYWIISLPSAPLRQIITPFAPDYGSNWWWHQITTSYFWRLLLWPYRHFPQSLIIFKSHLMSLPHQFHCRLWRLGTISINLLPPLSSGSHAPDPPSGRPHGNQSRWISEFGNLQDYPHLTSRRVDRCRRSYRSDTLADHLAWPFRWVKPMTSDDLGIQTILLSLSCDSEFLSWSQNNKLAWTGWRFSTW